MFHDRIGPWRGRLSLLLVVAGMTALPLLFAPQVQAAEEVTFSDIAWELGPCTGRLGDVAQIEVPEGFAFAPKQEMKKFMTLTQNVYGGSEMGVLLPTADDQSWFVIFEFDPLGYVKDDDRDKLDAAKLLASMRAGTEEANKERRKRGWKEMHIVGWAVPPNYDPQTNNLQWAIIGQDDDGQSVNHSTRLLGRRGVMSADLVTDPTTLDATLPAHRALLSGYSFVEGQRYAEYRAGDQIAKIGLTGLVAGGAGVALAKSGLLTKFIKPLIIATIAFFAMLGRHIVTFVRRVTGRDEETPTA